jgi:TonB family protein
MPQAVPSDVVTLDELARAVGVPRQAVRTLLISGDLQPVRDTEYYAATDAIRVAPQLRAAAVIRRPPRRPFALFERAPAAASSLQSRGRAPLVASFGVHAFLLLALWVSAGAPQTAAAQPQPEPARLVYLISPGAGGGGGGSGRHVRNVARLERRGDARSVASTPAVQQQRASARPAQTLPPPPPAVSIEPPPAAAPEPLPARTVDAPVVVTASRPQDREGSVDASRPAAEGPGAGSGGLAGTGQGAGNGAGRGSGLGDGSGGGTGGGVYRPGSGISPPRLLREVKADYTEEGRRRGINGDVLLETVVRRDGTVGDVTVRRGLGAGLDERAIAAVRQWRFAPATRLGEAVDVVVEVAVQFRLR